MGKKQTGMALTQCEAKLDVWREVLNSTWEIKAGGGKRMKIEAKPMRPSQAIYHAIVL